MITRDELQGSWTQLKGQIRERWGQITDDELQQVHGNAEELLGFLQKKTGESRQALESFFRDSLDHGSHYVQQAAETAREYARGAARSVREGYESLEQSVEEGYSEARQVVRARPVESVAAAFGAGLVAGVIVSLMFRSSRA